MQSKLNLTIQLFEKCPSRSTFSSNYHGIRNKSPLKPKFPIHLGGVSKIFACCAIRPRGVSKFRSQTCLNFNLKCCFLRQKTPKIYRALRARVTQNPEISPIPGGVSKIFACGAIRLGGFQNFTEIHQFGLGGISTRGGFIPNSLVYKCFL